MSAPKGNQYWKNRSKHGRDRIFASANLLREAAFEFFQWCDENPWTTQEVTKKSAKIAGKVVGMTEETMKEKPAQRPYSLEGFTLYVGASVSWWRNFKRNLDPEHKPADDDFLTVMEQIEQIIDVNQFEGATVGAYNANIIARKLGLVDKVENLNINREAKPLTDDEIKELNERLNKDY